MKNYSRQREAIIKYLSETDTHPTADEVFDHVRVLYPNISLATVYRNLNLLSEEGEIRRISCGSHVDRFDFRTAAHAHFMCNCCGRVSDVFLDMKKLSDFSNGMLPGSVSDCDLIFHGTCTDCGGAAS